MALAEYQCERCGRAQTRERKGPREWLRCVFCGERAAKRVDAKEEDASLQVPVPGVRLEL